MKQRYRCDFCGCYLDPGKKCDCLKEKQQEKADHAKIYYQKGDRSHVRRTVCV